MKKRFLAIILALAVCAGLLSVPAYASSSGDFRIGGANNNILYEYTGSGGNVVIPNGIVSIERDAFSGCTGLTSVTIPNSVTSIGTEAFSGCTGLTSVTIPNSVIWLGNAVFASCTGLTSVTIPNSVRILGASTFRNCRSLTSVTIPNSVEVIDEATFEGCTSLTSVTIPSSVAMIQISAFYGCTSLTSVTIPGSVADIGSMAFYGCTGLTSLTISSGVKRIISDAFKNCTGLTNVTIPSSVISIGSGAFGGCTGLTSITINNPYPIFSGSVFPGCKNLTIHGPSGSSVEEYANKYHIPFAAIGSASQSTTPAFTDVPSWFEKEVAWAVEKGITNGYGGSTTFAPNVECPHTQILTFLWRAAGKHTAAKAPITVASYYQDAVNWAYEKGLIDASFQPDAPCTRAQAVRYIWQALGEKEAKTAASFTDVAVGAPYAKAVSWAVEKGVTKGYGGSDTFAPDRVCSRGEIAAFLYRAYNN